MNQIVLPFSSHSIKYQHLNPPADYYGTYGRWEMFAHEDETIREPEKISKLVS